MIERRTGPDGAPRYRVRLYHQSRYVASRTFDRRRDAVVWEREQTRRLAAGTFVDLSQGSQSVAVWAQGWLDGLTGVAPSTRVRYEGLLTSHVLPQFGRRPLASVRPSEVQAFAGRLTAEYSASTARQAVGVLRQVCKTAVADGALTASPVAGVRLSRSRPNPIRPLSHEELWTLAEGMRNRRDRILVLVAGYSGLRWGELTALRVSDFRPGERRLMVERAFSEVRGSLVLGDVKDHAARSLVLPGLVAEELVAWVETVKSEEHSLLFPGRDGQPLRNRNFRRDVLSRSTEIIGRDVSAHHLRDTAASLAIGSGASVLAVARMLGHEDASVTLRHYAGLFPSDLDRLAESLNRAATIALRDRQAHTALPVDTGRPTIYRPQDDDSSSPDDH